MSRMIIAALILFLLCKPDSSWALLPLNGTLPKYDNNTNLNNIETLRGKDVTLYANSVGGNLAIIMAELTLHEQIDAFSRLCSEFSAERARITKKVNDELNKDGNRHSDYTSLYEKFKKKADSILKKLFERWEQNRDPNLLNRMQQLNEKLKAMQDALTKIDRWDYFANNELGELYHPSLGGRCEQLCKEFDATVKDFTGPIIPDQMREQIVELLGQGKECFDYKSSWARIEGLRERLHNRKEIIKETFTPSLSAGHDLIKEAEVLLSATVTPSTQAPAKTVNDNVADLVVRFIQQFADREAHRS